MSEKIKPGEQVPEHVAELFVKHEKYLAAGKANYAKSDQALDDLLQLCEPGVSITIPASGKGRTAKPARELVVVDQFADTNRVWSGSAAKRFKIEVRKIKPQDLPAETETEN